MDFGDDYNRHEEGSESGNVTGTQIRTQEHTFTQETQIFLENPRDKKRRKVEHELDPQDVSAELECGKIEFVELVDFMCHKHFQIKLQPHLNFITGPNGSKQ